MPETVVQDWRTLPPGREMDAPVWSRVFGRPEWEPSDEYPYGFLPQHYEEAGRPMFTLAPPYYSDDIGHAPAMIERLCERGWSTALFFAKPGQIGCRVYRLALGESIYCTGDPAGPDARISPKTRIISEASADTAPVALCRAALMALDADHA